MPGGSFLQSAHFFAERQIAFDLRIHPGNRAFSIPVEPDRGVGVFVTPGSHVDVIGPFVSENDAIITKPLLENAEVMAVGDSANDRGMLEWSGFSVAVANAEPRLREMADVVVPSNLRHGAAYAIRRFILEG